MQTRNFNLDGGTYVLNVTDTTNKCVKLLTISDDASGVAHLWTQYKDKISLNMNANNTVASITITENDDGKQKASSTKDSYSLVPDASVESDKGIRLGHSGTLSATSLTSYNGGTIVFSGSPTSNPIQHQTQ